MPTPSVGRIVHFVDADTTVCVAAVITQVNPDATVNVHIWAPSGGTAGIPDVPEAPSQPYAATSWHWPEVVS